MENREGEPWHSFLHGLDPYVSDERLASVESAVVIVFSKSEVSIIKIDSLISTRMVWSWDDGPGCCFWSPEDGLLYGQKTRIVIRTARSAEIFDESNRWQS